MPSGSWIKGRDTAVVPDKRGLVCQTWIEISANILCRPVTKIQHVFYRGPQTLDGYIVTWLDVTTMHYLNRHCWRVQTDFI